jgi:superfamily II DNA/RNA helicase
MSGRDMMELPKTGTGKTFAYLPLLKLYKFIPDILKNSNPSTTHLNLWFKW